MEIKIKPPPDFPGIFFLLHLLICLILVLTKSTLRISIDLLSTLSDVNLCAQEVTYGKEE